MPIGKPSIIIAQRVNSIKVNDPDLAHVAGISRKLCLLKRYARRCKVNSNLASHDQDESFAGVAFPLPMILFSDAVNLLGVTGGSEAFWGKTRGEAQDSQISVGKIKNNSVKNMKFADRPTFVDIITSPVLTF